jgi:hypothetical protein
MTPLAITSGLISAAMLVLGLGVLLPVSTAVGDFCSLSAVGSGIFFVGLLDNA